MKEHPILFSAPMVRAILAGEKTQTRRVVKPQPEPVPDHYFKDRRVPTDRQFWWPSNVARSMVEVRDMGSLSPYGMHGDRLWVKETWQYADWTEDGMPWVRYAADDATRFHDSGAIPEEWGERLTDVWADLSTPENVAIDGKAADRKWRPSLFMPRWASRITLEVTEVRVQRLQEISEADAIAEGVWKEGRWFRGGTHPVKGSDQYWSTATRAYQAIWETINGAGSWGLNLWVWVVSFRRVP